MFLYFSFLFRLLSRNRGLLSNSLGSSSNSLFLSNRGLLSGRGLGLLSSLIHGRFLSGNIGRLLGSFSLSPFIQEFLVFFAGLLSLDNSVGFIFLLDSLVSQSGFSNNSLDLGSFSSLFSRSGFPSSSDGEFSDQNLSLFFIVSIIFNLEIFSNFGCSLGSQSSGLFIIGQTFNILFSLFNNRNSQNSDVGINNTSSDGFSLSFTGSSGSVTRVSFAH
jgi:hypothetical protein